LTGAEHGDQSEPPHPAATASTGQQSAAPDRPGRRSFWSADWREIISRVVELAGIGVLSAGFWPIGPWFGLMLLGAGLIVIGFANSPGIDGCRRSR
jgi:hypothetical protein